MTQDIPWTAVVAEVEERIKALRVELEKDLDPTDTSKVRGGIDALRKLLDLPNKVTRRKQQQLAPE